MSKSLNNHLDILLNDAVKLLTNYQSELIQEWELTLQSLKNTKKRSIAVFEFISEFLVAFLYSVHNGNADLYKMLDEIQREWHDHFKRDPEPEALIFHLNLLENSAHKVLKSRIAYSSKLHPSVHYLFSKISEVMLFQSEKENNTIWKDAVILFNEWIIRSQNFSESVENICFGFGHFLPFKRCALFKFTNKERVGVGLFGHQLNNEDVKAIAEKITNIPVLNESIVKLKSQGHEMKNFQPIYIPVAEKDLPEKYVKKFELSSLIIVPIYVPEEGKIIGGVVLDQGPGNHFTVDTSLYPALMKFGQSSGELLSKFIQAEIKQPNFSDNSSVTLSPRETEIIKLLADGASTAEAALKLYLSEFTVRDYISNIMKRLNAQNRTEVAVKAIRMGLIE
ncbi:response regulator transcription factor [Paenibacillus sp. BSR1-1]|uniref:response regulator transcription factor n=1 Tax=Paenibacillus sp. BSR1-1 TaxID=3020845 RepID=UPI0025B08F36|nr:response regulator transcription factor [Paenibacillus sp. BSR1-1]MDN3015001.1 response regulator transcription factor [Paenibacillus sp. BSR1-1]